MSVQDEGFQQRSSTDCFPSSVMGWPSNLYVWADFPDFLLEAVVEVRTLPKPSNEKHRFRQTSHALSRLVDLLEYKLNDLIDYVVERTRDIGPDALLDSVLWMG